MKNIYHEADAVTLRFVEVVEYLREECHISVSRIERELGITPTMLHRQMRNPERGIIRPYWIENICRVYRVRPLWLVLGVGDRFYDCSNPPLYLERSNKAIIDAHTSFTAE